jgi:flagellar motility protein MotE (MotC chaperone)
MKGRWWTVALAAVTVKIYLLGSWLWRDDNDAHASKPAAVAAEAPHSAPVETVKAPVAAAAPAPEAGACIAALTAVRAERSAMRSERSQLRAREQALVAREQALALRERAAEERLTRALTLSRDAHEAVKRALGEAGARARERAARLGKLLQAMKPAEAAQMLGRVKIASAVAALSAMDEKRAGKILGQLPPERAAEVGERMLLAVPPPADKK